MYHFSFLFAVLIKFSSGQAPGDYNEFCRKGMNAALHDFPVEVKILMDTFDYTALYGSAGTPWTAVDGDNDGRNWDTIFGNPCTFGLTTCTRRQSQDNWLFSQFISYVGAREVFFNVTYRFNRCRSPTCTKRYADLYQHVRDSANAGARVQPSNYGEPFLRLEQPSGDEGSIDVTHAIPRPANRHGFYLGVRDEGTCGAIERIIVYYVACLESVDGLVTYPETGVPVRGGSNFIFDAHCAPNAHNTTTLQVTAFASSSSCSPVAPGGARCECDAGYLISADGLSCRACPPGTYRTLSDRSCRVCPPNTVTDVMAAPQCDCISGFFRRPQEGPEMGCIQPPSTCTNLRVTARTNTSITVNWRRPATTGRGDYSYRIFHSDPENIGRFILARDNMVDGSSTVTFTLTSLVPLTQYIIRVTTHNGVSDQDLDNADSRMCEITTVTREGVPGQPRNVRTLCSAVAWQEPTQPNGVIIGYDVQFSVGRLTRVSTGETFLITATAERTPGTTVRVRAVNSAGHGAWSPLQDIECTSAGSCQPDLHFKLHGVTYMNNTMVVVDDIGEGDNALFCITDNSACCRSTSQGEFRFPNGSLVPTANAQQDFYRNRGSQFIRLNRRNGASSPLGKYSCDIPNASGVSQRIFLKVVELPPTLTPPTPIQCPPAVTCPPVSCLNSQAPPTSMSAPQTDLHFKLHGATYMNNTMVVVDDIGEGENALFCVTDNSACCRSTGQGEFMFPNGSLVPTANAQRDFYRNRGSQFIRFNRRNGATSPLGKYSCDIPNASGDLQRIFLEVVQSRHGACPTLTPPTPIQCPPTVTCPTIPSTTECPVLTCPPVSCPNCPTHSTSTSAPQTALRFELNGTSFLNNTAVMVEDIGGGENALFCVTDNISCCKDSRQGEFLFPNGTRVPVFGAGQDFYRNRDSQIIRMNRRNGAMSPVGRYGCEIPDANGVLQRIFIQVMSPTCMQL